MSKHYEKDVNGKYHLVMDKQEPQPKQEQEGTPEQRAFVREVMEGPKLKELDSRVKRLEAIVLGDRVKG